jgi:SAM-dependent methyltransferase
MSPGYDPDHFAALFAVEDRHFWFEARNLALKAVIEQIALGLPPGYRVLEIGCGTGNTLRVLKEACSSAALIAGVDLFVEGLVYARRRTKLPLVCARIENAPFAVPFEVVGMFDVLEHIEDDAAALCVVRALTAPGGHLLLTVPAHKALWSRFDEESHHCRRYEPDELRERLTDAGFSIDYLTPFMAPLYPIARVSRWWGDLANNVRRRLGMKSTSAVMNDLAVRPLLNDIMAFVLRPEARRLRRRQQLHMGTSLLAVARVT